MLSFLLGLFFFILGTIGAIFIGPYLGISVFAAFTHITPQQLHISFLRPAFTVALFSLFSYLYSSNYPKKFNIFPAECFFFLIMLSGMLLGALYAYDSQLAFQNLLTYLKYFFYFILFVNIIDTQFKLKVFQDFLILSAAWLVYKCWDLRWTTGNRFENMDGGVVGDSNHFAAALVLLLPLVMVNIFRKDRNVLIRILTIIGVFGILVSIFTTGSRGGVIGLFACIASFILLENKYRKTIMIVVLVLGISAFPFIPDNTIKRVQMIFHSDQETLDHSSLSRLNFWGTAIEVWKNNPFYGCGLGNFIYYNGYENEGKNWGEMGHVAHSLWFEALAEGGILVFGSILGLVYLFFYRTISVKRYFSSNHSIVLDINSIQSGMIGFLVCATFLNRLIYEPIYWWCGMAYVYHCQLINDNITRTNDV